MAADGSAEWRRRSELAGLLRACRSRLIRADADGHAGGLRQEDVADLAGLSVRGYAAFERGENASPRPETADAVAAALRMTGAERECLRFLAAGRDRPPPAADDGARPGVSPVFLELLARQEPDPAFIADETWALIAWNGAAGAWAGPWLARAPDGYPNLALYLFSDQCAERLADVRAARRAMIAGLRYQYARDIASDRLAGLIAALLDTGPEARELWDRHEVAIPPREYQLRIRHPGRGVIQAPGAAMPISARLSMHVVALPAGVTPPDRLPRPPDGTAGRIGRRRLMPRRPPGNRRRPAPPGPGDARGAGRPRAAPPASRARRAWFRPPLALRLFHPGNSSIISSPASRRSPGSRQPPQLICGGIPCQRRRSGNGTSACHR